MRTSKVYLSRACYSKRVGHHHLCLGETPRQARDWERFTTGKKKKDQLISTLYQAKLSFQVKSTLRHCPMNKTRENPVWPEDISYKKY